MHRSTLRLNRLVAHGNFITSLSGPSIEKYYSDRSPYDCIHFMQQTVFSRHGCILIHIGKDSTKVNVDVCVS
jgi:hypothetical protein